MDIENLKKEYELESSNYIILCKEVIRQIDVLLNENSIKLAVPIHYRVKDWESIIEKCQRNSLELTEIGEMNDIAGIRIVTLFKSDISTIQEIINTTFNVLREDDTANRLSENQFGYGSVHYEINLPNSWVEIPAFKALKGKTLEIQLRTAPQHTWAAASHILNYKKESHVPKPVRRTINRVSALLETVDLEFERVLREREEFDSLPMEKVDQLNTDTLRRVLNSLLPEVNKGDDEDYATMLDELNKFEIITVGKVEELIKKNLSEALKNDKRRVAGISKEISEGNESAFENNITTPERFAKGIFYKHMGLLREILRKEFGEKEVNGVITQSVKARA